jgi:hypothetical protein
MSGLSKKKIERKKGARALPKRKRGAPRGQPGIPGQGECSVYHAKLDGATIWITDSKEIFDLSLCGSFGKGIIY